MTELPDTTRSIAKALREQFQLGPIGPNAKEQLLAGSAHLSLTFSEAERIAELAIAADRKALHEAGANSGREILQKS